MNSVITTHVFYRGRKISVSELKPNSNIKVEVECKHGRRWLKWIKRNQPCKRCAVEAGVYNTSHKGRKITWGDNISNAKKGKKFSDDHKKALSKARISNYCKRAGIDIKDFKSFPTKGERYKLRCFMMGALNKCVIRMSIDKQDSLFIDKLGYTVEDLKTHLESKFKPGMSWDNYGEWHIDHIVPDSWFNYSSIEDENFKKSWAIDNLQPLWDRENVRKNSLYAGKYKDKNIYFLCGQSGVGKTTLANMLIDKFTVIEYDDHNIKSLNKTLSNNWHNDRPILLVSSVHISTLYKRYSEKYNINVVMVIEDVNTVRDRIISRGGSNFKSLDRRNKRMLTLSKTIANFSGNFDEVYKYLSNL